MRTLAASSLGRPDSSANRSLRLHALTPFPTPGVGGVGPVQGRAAWCLMGRVSEKRAGRAREGAQRNSLAAFPDSSRSFEDRSPAAPGPEISLAPAGFSRTISRFAGVGARGDSVAGDGPQRR